MNENKTISDTALETIETLDQKEAPSTACDCPYYQKTPAKGFGAAGMVLGIIGVLWTFVFCINTVDYYFYIDEAISHFIVIGILSVLAVVFGAIARAKKNRTGVAVSAITLGICAVCMTLFAVAASLIFY